MMFFGGFTAAARGIAAGHLSRRLRSGPGALAGTEAAAR